MTTPHILPAEASPVGKYRGICDWADRPLAYWLADRIDQLAFQTLAGINYSYKPNGATRVGSDLQYLEFNADVAAPLAVLSTTQVANLNVAMLGGKTFAAPAAIGSTTPAAGTFTTVTTEKAVVTNAAPASASATGTAGEIRSDADYIYVCTATDTWKRVAIATWV